MYFEHAIYLIIIIFMTSGIYILKGNGRLKWNLKKRLYLRNGVTNSVAKYTIWQALDHTKQGSLLSVALDIIKKNKTEKMDKEIFEAITFLRNMAAIGKGKTTNTDSILEMLAQQKGLLQPIYMRMLSLLRLNKKSEAVESFSKDVGTIASKDFARILIQWDELDPIELSETLLSFEKSLREIRITNQARKDQVVSDLIYFPVVLNILVIFINFIYVAYFLDQKEMLQMFISL